MATSRSSRMSFFEAYISKVGIRNITWHCPYLWMKFYSVGTFFKTTFKLTFFILRYLFLFLFFFFFRRLLDFLFSLSLEYWTGPSRASGISMDVSGFFTPLSFNSMTSWSYNSSSIGRVSSSDWIGEMPFPINGVSSLTSCLA